MNHTFFTNKETQQTFVWGCNEIYNHLHNNPHPQLTTFPVLIHFRKSTIYDIHNLLYQVVQKNKIFE